MKRLICVIFSVALSISSYSQTFLTKGDSCFDKGDYTCAIAKYSEHFNLTIGKDKQIAEIKLTRAKWCAERTKIADQAFSINDFQTAKAEYQNVLESNPKDIYVNSQIEKCNTLLKQMSNLRKATIADLNDIWNNKYGVNPERRQNLINAGIDPVDAQARINKGEGKPVPGSFSVLSENISFSANGGKTAIEVLTTYGDYQVVLLPLWCNVINKDASHFTVDCDPNHGEQRNDWFIVRSGSEEIKIYVSQSGSSVAVSKVTNNQPTNKPIQSSQKVKKCFNCPKTNDTWGLIFGYTQLSNDFHSYEGVQFGLRAEPLFKYGFGLTTGIIFEGYTKNKINTHIFSEGFNLYAVNVPLHLEYRLNFSKWFNIFTFGGIGINATTNSAFNEFSYPVCFEYGGGLRISRLQFNLGRSSHLGDLWHLQDMGKIIKPYQKFVGSFSIML